MGFFRLFAAYGNVDQPEGVMVSYDVFDRNGCGDQACRTESSRSMSSRRRTRSPNRADR